MKKNRPTCSPWLHARLGEQLGLSPRSSGRVGGLSTGAERTRRSAKGVRLAGRDNRKQNSDPSHSRELGGVRHGASSPCRYPATSHSRFATPRHHYLTLLRIDEQSRAAGGSRPGPDPEPKATTDQPGQWRPGKGNARVFSNTRRSS